MMPSSLLTRMMITVPCGRDQYLLKPSVIDYDLVDHEEGQVISLLDVQSWLATDSKN